MDNGIGIVLQKRQFPIYGPESAVGLGNHPAPLQLVDGVGN